MRTKAFGTNGLPPAAPAANGRLRLSARPPPVATPARMKWRRERSLMSASLRVRLGGLLDGRADAAVRAAAADVAGHRVVDVGVGRMGVARQQGRRRHDLAGLA